LAPQSVLLLAGAGTIKHPVCHNSDLRFSPIGFVALLLSPDTMEVGHPIFSCRLIKFPSTCSAPFLREHSGMYLLLGDVLSNIIFEHTAALESVLASNSLTLVVMSFMTMCRLLRITFELGLDSTWYKWRLFKFPTPDY
jgi:hypothetical protein